MYQALFGKVNNFSKSYSFSVDWTLSSHRCGQQGAFCSDNIEGQVVRIPIADKDARLNCASVCEQEKRRFGIIDSISNCHGHDVEEI